MVTNARYFVGLELGQANDFTALAVLCRPSVLANTYRAERRPPYALCHLQRFPPGTHYDLIVTDLRTLLQTAALRGRSMLVVDKTGVGQAVVNLFEEGLRHQVTCNYLSITLTTGHEVGASLIGGRLVPKKELVSAIQVLLQNRRLQIPKHLPESDILVKELHNFRMKSPLIGKDTFEAWREGANDDLVLGLGLAAWFGESELPPLVPSPQRRLPTRLRAI